MQSEINKIHEEIQKLESLQDKLDKKTRDAAAYKENNAQLVSLLKFSLVVLVICIVIFCVTLLMTFNKFQKDFYNWISDSTIETVTEKEDMTADNNGVILNGVSDSSFAQSNTY